MTNYLTDYLTKYWTGESVGRGSPLLIWIEYEEENYCYRQQESLRVMVVIVVVVMVVAVVVLAVVVVRWVMWRDDEGKGR